MQPIPSDILIHFEAVLKKRAVPVSRHADYRKRLRYYLDFRGKNTLPDSKSEHVRLFLLYRMGHVIMNGVVWKNQDLLIGKKSSAI